MRFSRLGVALVSSVAIVASAVSPAAAAPDGTNIVINEVYGGGGNSGATYTHDFVELYNPTDAPISLDGMYLQYTSVKGKKPNSGNILQLAGETPAKGYTLIQLAQGSGGTRGIEADLEGDIAMSGKGGIVALTNSADPWTPSAQVVDLLGWGEATFAEGNAAPGTSNSVSVQRAQTGVDTDNNATDFVTGAPTPGDLKPENAGTVTIAEIQGTGPVTPLDGQRVTTSGYVTASYPEGGFDGFYMQQGGEKSEASNGIFVFLGRDGQVPEVGSCVTVTGTAGEYTGETQLSDPEVVPDTDCGPTVVPTEFSELPEGDAAREAYEGMLVQVTGPYTVSNNYELNTYGTVGLAPGTEPFYQPTDVFPPSTDPNSEVQKLAVSQGLREVSLDDGRSRNYAKSDTETPLPYLVTGGKTVKSLRAGDTVTFTEPVIVSGRYDKWGLQPTVPITGNSESLPITWEDSRAAEEAGPNVKDSELSLASFNVLNYFTTLGETEEGCKAYTDREGNNVTANWCTVRGAWSTQAFTRQQAKIVNAINTLNVSVLGLEEIENTASVTGDASRRDEALSKLVAALNADLTARGKEPTWELVASPEKVPGREDVIRVAFIYNKTKVAPVGPSVIIDDPAYTGVARQPLGQAFARVGQKDPEFVAVVNHFKSKGSVARGDKDQNDGQGNNPNLRAEQARALTKAIAAHEEWNDMPVFVVGDLNSYTKEDTMKVLEDAGYTNIAATYDSGHSYQFAGRIGSLDHAFGNAAAMKLVVDADVWDINSDESIAFEYSRENYNIAPLVDDSVFRSSDHDPIKVAFNLGTAKPDQPSKPGDSGDSGAATGSNTSSDLPPEAVAALEVIGGLVGAILGLLGIGAAAQHFAPDLVNQVKGLFGI